MGKEDTVSNFIECKSCKKTVAKSAKACPHCGAKLKGGIIGKLIGGFFILIAISMMIDDGKEGAKLSNSSNNSTKTSTKSNLRVSEPAVKVSEPAVKVSEPSISIPTQQTNFINMISGYASDYKKAANQLKKSALRRKRSKSIQEFLGDNLSVQWVGTVGTLATTSQQNAHMKINLLGTEIIFISNANNELSDLTGPEETLIQIGSSFYDIVSEFEERDKVKITGSFLKDSTESDYIFEQSISERGSMTEPEFLFKFESIEKI